MLQLFEQFAVLWIEQLLPGQIETFASAFLTLDFRSQELLINVLFMYLFDQISVLLVEDHDGFTALLKILLSEMGIRDIFIANSFETGHEAFLLHQPDVCILDIDLGKSQKSGVDLAQKIRETNENIPIIFLTANYSEETYEQTRHTRPTAFMNKELSRFKLQQAIDLALLHRTVSADSSESKPINCPPTPPHISLQHFFFKIGDAFKAIPVQDVAYFYADQKLTYARVAERKYPTTVQLKTLEETFSDQFVRIHKSYLINFRYIESLQTKDYTVIVAGESLPIGYAYRKSFFARLHFLR